MTEAQVQNAVEKFEALIRAQSDRSDKIKTQGDFTDFKALDKIIIFMAGIAQLVRVPGCGPGGHRFESDYPPQQTNAKQKCFAFFIYCIYLGV